MAAFTVSLPAETPDPTAAMQTPLDGRQPASWAARLRLPLLLLIAGCVSAWWALSKLQPRRSQPTDSSLVQAEIEGRHPGQLQSKPQEDRSGRSPSRDFLAAAPPTAAASPDAQPASVEDLHQRHASGVTVDLVGTVHRHLRDEVGSRHLQRFVVRLTSGHTVVVVRDLDRAARVPVKAGDAVQAHGRYVWTQDGGIVHGTHRGAAGPDAGGWIVHAGRTYR